MSSSGYGLVLTGVILRLSQGPPALEPPPHPSYFRGICGPRDQQLQQGGGGCQSLRLASRALTGRGPMSGEAQEGSVEGKCRQPTLVPANSSCSALGRESSLGPTMWGTEEFPSHSPLLQDGAVPGFPALCQDASHPLLRLQAKHIFLET